jgi:hypothetical protein
MAEWLVEQGVSLASDALMPPAHWGVAMFDALIVAGLDIPQKMFERGHSFRTVSFSM